MPRQVTFAGFQMHSNDDLSNVATLHDFVTLVSKGTKLPRKLPTSPMLKSVNRLHHLSRHIDTGVTSRSFLTSNMAVSYNPDKIEGFKLPLAAYDVSLTPHKVPRSEERHIELGRPEGQNRRVQETAVGVP